MLITYAASHMIVDFSCAFLIFSRSDFHLLSFLLYNFCAFALQMPMGILVHCRGRTFSLVGCGLVLLAILLPLSSIPAAICAGLGNAAFHIGGGTEVLDQYDHFGPLGLFVSPGALGLFLGKFLADSISPLLPLALLLFTILALSRSQRLQLPKDSTQSVFRPTIFFKSFLLFAVVALRSILGCTMHFSWANEYPWTIPLVVTAGKLLGGYICDHFGETTVAILSLSGAALLFLMAEFMPFGVMAILLFNMTMPLTLGALARLMPHAKPFSFGLLTFALFLGYLPSLWNVSLSTLHICGLCVLSMLLLLLYLRKDSHADDSSSLSAANGMH